MTASFNCQKHLGRVFPGGIDRLARLVGMSGGDLNYVNWGGRIHPLWVAPFLVQAERVSRVLTCGGLGSIDCACTVTSSFRILQ